jgi:hypothetical protein
MSTGITTQGGTERFDLIWTTCHSTLREKISLIGDFTNSEGVRAMGMLRQQPRRPLGDDYEFRGINDSI